MRALTKPKKDPTSASVACFHFPNPSGQARTFARARNRRNTGKSSAYARLTFFACKMDISSPPVAINW